MYKKAALEKAKLKNSIVCEKDMALDSMAEITADGIYFSGNIDAFYSFKDKKFKSSARNVWYYSSDTAKYM